ncbi:MULTISPECIES: hypothetical protein [Kitasatospora]|uniref:Uncharacterized protein n=2 Tax=Kitasatospora TaxID=2063 RepID=A0ABT1JAB7_9ACTN|nr:hypothetical protein [Kitasatospora paracochleata]MCP2314408.1 hypothetical protein [Kitasatospora paracochleata]
MSDPSLMRPVKPPKKNIFTGLSPWQVALTMLPLALLLVGGAIGGAIGGVGMVVNAKVAKAPMGTPAKAALMAGVVLTAAVVYLTVAVLLVTVLNS